MTLWWPPSPRRSPPLPRRSPPSPRRSQPSPRRLPPSARRSPPSLMSSPPSLRRSPQSPSFFEPRFFQAAAFERLKFKPKLTPTCLSSIKILGPNFFDPKLTRPKLFQTERTRRLACLPSFCEFVVYLHELRMSDQSSMEIYGCQVGGQC